MTTGNGSISRNELTTNGSGVASMVYYAGNNLEPDILQATTDGAFTQLIITKSGQVLGYTAEMLATPSEFAGDDTPLATFICNSILTVTVKNNDGLPARGLRVRFNTPTSLGGTITSTFTPSSDITGIDGKAITNLSIGLPVGTFVVDAYVDVNDNGVQDSTEPTAAVTLTVTES